MENIIAVMVDKFRNGSGERSIKSIKEVLKRKVRDEYEVGRFASVEERNNFILLNILSHAYQEGISAGKKLAARDGMNEIDAVQFTIKQLQKVKDDLKSSLADEIVKNK